MSFFYGVSSVVPNFVQSNGLKMLSRREDFENLSEDRGERERERQNTLLCFMQLEREPVVTFFEAGWNRVENVGRNYTSVATGNAAT